MSAVLPFMFELSQVEVIGLDTELKNQFPYIVNACRDHMNSSENADVDTVPCYIAESDEALLFYRVEGEEPVYVPQRELINYFRGPDVILFQDFCREKGIKIPNIPF